MVMSLLWLQRSQTSSQPESKRVPSSELEGVHPRPAHPRGPAVPGSPALRLPLGLCAFSLCVPLSLSLSGSGSISGSFGVFVSLLSLSQVSPCLSPILTSVSFCLSFCVFVSLPASSSVMFLPPFWGCSILLWASQVVQW